TRSIPGVHGRDQQPQALFPRARLEVRGVAVMALPAAAIVLAFALPGSAATPSDLAANVVVEGTISDLQARIASGQLHCQDVVAASLARIKAYDQPRGLKAITTLSPTALAQARATDKQLARHHAMPPLFCVPVVVKDNIDTGDMPTTGGSMALRTSKPPDAQIVQRPRAAGALTLAKSDRAEGAFSPLRT